MFSKIAMILSLTFTLMNADRFGSISENDPDSRNGFARLVESFNNGHLFETMKTSHSNPFNSASSNNPSGYPFERFHQQTNPGFESVSSPVHTGRYESPQSHVRVSLNGQKGAPEYSGVEVTKLGQTAHKFSDIQEHGNQEVIRGFQDFRPSDVGVKNTNAEGYGNQVQQDGYVNNIEHGMPYQFEYNVNEYGNLFGHAESSDGKLVTGRYYVRLPDGRLQTVDFKSDPFSGYTANVQYEGQAQYPIISADGNQYSSGTSTNVGVHGGSVGHLPLEDFSGTILRKRSRPSKPN